jgi:hypothetical protein
MRVPDRCVADLRDQGYLVFEGFLDGGELEAAQEGLWLHYPRPEEYFADPGAHAWLATDQWAGIIGGPWRSWNLNRLAFHPDLLDLAERFLGSADLRLYEAELWAKYAGAVDYDQSHHRDFVNHSLVVPKRSQPATQMGELDPPVRQGVVQLKRVRGVFVSCRGIRLRVDSRLARDGPSGRRLPGQAPSRSASKR